MANELSPLQSKLLEMLKWFDAFCRAHRLRYYAVGGTLLGAVRHGGFIPWDDDIDVAMPRPDYERLAALIGDSTTEHYYLETVHSKDASYCYPYFKLYDTETTLTENKRRKLRRGVFLDVFPLDGIGSDYEKGMRHFDRLQAKYNFYLTRVGGFRKGRSIYKNCAVFLSRLIPKFLVDDEKLRVELDALCRSCDFETSEWVGNLLGAWRKREIVKRDVIGEPKDYAFENMQVLGVEDYDAYLTHIYGDWKQLPPEEKRVSHHDFLEFDLHRSYLAKE